LGHNELINSLRRDGEETVKRLWSEVKAEAEKIASETSQRIGELKEEHAKILDLAVMKEERSVLSEAEKRVSIIRLSMEQGLSERLFPLAVSCLGELRTERYRDVFTSLADELPDTEWEEVRVNSRDEEIAREVFPGLRIVTDNNISGGLEVIRKGGKISVANTFKKRLENAWQDILPLLIKDICKEGEDNGSASAL
jgi:vacuolar-type H+-ATPase subunit E/Vma4